MSYFKLAEAIYGCKFENSTIILDAENDNYISLIDPASYYLPIIISTEFSYDKITSNYSLDAVNTEELNHWINFFLENKIIVKCNTLNKKTISQPPVKSGGLSNYQWDKKSAWEPFKNSRKTAIFIALVTLIKVHFQMKLKGIKGILNLINKYSSKIKTVIPSEQDIEQLSNTIDAASIIYPSKTFCLAWAATFVIMAKKMGWNNCNLVIGIQDSPFYAHAWAEVKGKVINDDPIIAEVLSIILKTT